LLDDTARGNRLLESLVERMPAQYYWVHRRFKSRPPGHPPVY
jgi:KDO2-lipid IV(A) lauroyltransferase